MRVSAWLVLGLCLLRTPAFAGNEVDAAQGVIRAQEQALARDDGATAYAQAAPEIQALFPSIEIFMAMVREGYAPVYRHRSFEFGPSQAQDGTIMQRVHIVDANGEAWEALYTLQAQTDGSLKITGCSLLKAGQSV
ncbi:MULTISPECIES: DUF4864 domain-containing protein [Bradyrhizobium]|jgi:hypothetical protein|uniref:DUF4864 domain-containing protein n=1 Tax=Bradyrhizobium TaxID=374 RepID=UPI00005DE84F|nr:MULTISPECIES: DUF4864 domain-containing protein [Bradyrhizobium]ABQ38422.1 putative exported protein of unknown function [Bradyrhizobium sp. BTAi1]MCL8484527.1 DUF4864 domain-containing protein [Bradyrhizobium denitrificans]RTL95352.1 MAG: DUF4864 domain-containing protein [Bradyrhizobiaceae bacterium]